MPMVIQLFTVSATDLRERFLLSGIFYLHSFLLVLRLSWEPAVQPQCKQGFKLIFEMQTCPTISSNCKNPQKSHAGRFYLRVMVGQSTKIDRSTKIGVTILLTGRHAMPVVIQRFTVSATDLRERFLLSGVFSLHSFPLVLRLSWEPAVQPQCKQGFKLIFETQPFPTISFNCKNPQNNHTGRFYLRVMAGQSTKILMGFGLFLQQASMLEVSCFIRLTTEPHSLH